MSGSLGTEMSKTPKAVGRGRGDIYWAAGFIEGEGNFERSRVMATQVQREPLERLQRMFGGTITVRPTRPANPTWKPQYQWAAYGSRGRGVIQTIYGLLSPRRKEQARKALSR